MSDNPIGERKSLYGMFDLFRYNFMPHSNICRPTIQEVKKHFGNKTLTGVEIGTSFGLNAKNICDNLNIEKLYCVDPYVSDKYSNHFIYASRILKNYPVSFINKYSVKAVNSIPDLVDFVYIDGDHSEKGCYRDLVNYFPIVKHGGFIGGHDFKIEVIGVVKAVMRFAVENNLRFFGRRNDFWFIKDGEL